MNDLPEFFRGKKVLITGHSGFKGAWLSEILLGFGAKVAGLALKPHTRPQSKRSGGFLIGFFYNK